MIDALKSIFREPLPDNERGSNMIEYALLAAILIVLLSQIPELLYAAAERKAVSTAEMHEEMSPCGGSLSGDECM